MSVENVKHEARHPSPFPCFHAHMPRIATHDIPKLSAWIKTPPPSYAFKNPLILHFDCFQPLFDLVSLSFLVAFLTLPTSCFLHPPTPCLGRQRGLHELEGLHGVLVHLRFRDVRKHVQDLAFGVDQHRRTQHAAALGGCGWGGEGKVCEVRGWDTFLVGRVCR